MTFLASHPTARNMTLKLSASPPFNNLFAVVLLDSVPMGLLFRGCAPGDCSIAIWILAAHPPCLHSHGQDNTRKVRIRKPGQAEVPSRGVP